MKKFLVFALCVTGFMFIAAPTAVEYHRVFLNGKPFANAALINGIIAVKVSDLATGVGDTLTLEHFKLDGHTLTTVPDGTSNTLKPLGGASPASKVREAALDPAVKKAQTQAKIKSAPNALIIVVRKAGQVSNSVFTFQGQSWVPLKDVAIAIGTSFNQPVKMLPNDSFQLNAPSNVNALIGLL
jgi:hypothetical protein